MTVCRLVAGGSAAQRAAAIAAGLDGASSCAVILEGPAQPLPPLLAAPPHGLRVATIAIGCPCCGDGLVMRVTLDRMLRARPALLAISLADPFHLPHLRRLLSDPPYAARIAGLTELLVNMAPPPSFP